MRKGCDMSKKKRAVSRRKFMGSVAGAGAGAAFVEKAGNAKNAAAQNTIIPPGALSINTSNSTGMNIIVIIADSWRWDYLGITGNTRIKTPNIDALAAEGVYFDNCYADGLPTIPARRVMHTGNSIIEGKSKWKPLENGDITFANILGKAGFTTSFIVDTFHHFKPDMNFHKDFDSFTWIRGQEVDRYKSGPKNSVNPENHVPEHLLSDDLRTNMTQYLLNTKDRSGEEDYFCAQSCNAAEEWLAENKDNDGPFMMFMDMFDPHEPWDAPPRFQKMYRDSYPFDRYLFGYGVDVDDVREEDYPILRDLYSAEVSFSDHCIGKLIDRVKSLGLWDNTIIAFSSDHGTHLGEQGCIQKQAKLLNSCIARVPLIIRHPDKSTHGKRIDALTSHMDFMPTFLEMLGVKTNREFDGQNMWDLITGAKDKLRDYAVTGYGNYGSVHTEKWHYLRNVWGKEPGLGPQLYDITVDHNEEVNVIADHPDVVTGLEAIMESEFGVELG
jgi:arylsulfatase A-like enzyme